MNESQEQPQSPGQPPTQTQTTGTQPLLALPAPQHDNDNDRPERQTKLDVSTGIKVAMPDLGPVVINSDGTISRISNWQAMAEVERERTLRVLAKRNMIRREKLEDEDAKIGEGKDT